MGLCLQGDNIRKTWVQFYCGNVNYPHTNVAMIFKQTTVAARSAQYKYFILEEAPIYFQEERLNGAK